MENKEDFEDSLIGGSIWLTALIIVLLSVFFSAVFYLLGVLITWISNL